MAETFKPLGWADEPQTPGAVVAVHFGDYRRQEIWVRSGANIGAWYPLGSEFGRPKVWVDPRSELEKIGMFGRSQPGPGPGEIPLHPDWGDVLARGPVTLLAASDEAAYEAGWGAGRRDLLARIQDLAEEGSR